jgi:hypothetical protein
MSDDSAYFACAIYWAFSFMAKKSRAWIHYFRFLILEIFHHTRGKMAQWNYKKQICFIYWLSTCAWRRSTCKKLVVTRDKPARTQGLIGVPETRVSQEGMGCLWHYWWYWLVCLRESCAAYGVFGVPETRVSQRGVGCLWHYWWYWLVCLREAWAAYGVIGVPETQVSQGGTGCLSWVPRCAANPEVGLVSSSISTAPALWAAGRTHLLVMLQSGMKISYVK